MIEKLLPLQVIIPLLAAPMCGLLPSRRLAWWLATIATVASCLIAVALLGATINGTVLTYAMGGWPIPFGIEYRVDLLNAFVMVLVTSVGAVMMPLALRSVDYEVLQSKQPLFYATYLLCLAGLLGIAITNDAFNIYVFLEISSLAMYTLIAMGANRKAYLASFEYLILGTIGATFILIGVGLLYMMTGSLNLTDLKVWTEDKLYGPAIVAAFAFITLGLLMKIALFPLHLWLTNAYTYAPSFISAFLSATATKVGIYVLMRYLFTFFGVFFALEAMPLDIILIILSTLALIIGSMTAIFQQNIKRMLAFSSVAQIGYIMLGIGYASATGLTASLVHLFNHAITKGALFAAIACVAVRVGGVKLQDIQGLGKQMPWTMAAFVVAGLSLIGIPMTAGFISKWYLVKMTVEHGDWFILAVILASSIMALIYVWKVVEAAYFYDRPEGAKNVREAPKSMLLSVWILTGATIFLGIYTEPTVGVAERIVTFILKGVQ